jgi:alpha-tubulin suppressor-like RCC1 family protein
MAKRPRKFGKHGVPTTDDKGLTPNATSGNADSGIDITNTPVGDVRVLVDGTQYVVGDGVDSKDCLLTEEVAENLANIGTGFDTSFIIDGDGYGWGIGANFAGQTGTNTQGVDRTSPTSMVGGHMFVEIVGGEDSNMGLKADGTVWCWGDDELPNDTFVGKLGQNQNVGQKSSPVSVVGNHSFVKVGTSEDARFGLKEDGTVWGWGSAASGQLGIGTTSGVGRSSPVSIVGDHSFIDIMISIGDLANHCAGLKTDGTVWSWGDNYIGQIGDGTASNRSSPVSVVGNHSFIQIDGGGTVIALKADGTAWGWGDGDRGGIGDGNNVYRSSPSSVVGNHSFVEIRAGDDFGLGRKEDGTVWCWGEGSHGKLGINTDINNRSSPVSVAGNHSFVAVRTGRLHTVALKENGEVWTWGYGSEAQLGDGGIANRSSPVSVLGGTFNTDAVVPRSIIDIVAGDSLYWNGDVAGFDLSPENIVDLDYDTED